MSQLVTAGILEVSGAPRNVLRLLTRTSNSGWSKNGGPLREDYVAFYGSAADSCRERKVRLVGVDYLSVDPFDAGENDFPVHKKLLAAGTVIVESLDLAGVRSC